ncbi:MAG: hypothetical protein ACRBC3_07630 [Burkholderiaceae bacterium]
MLQLVLNLSIQLILLYLLIDGWWTGSVWVKGAASGRWSLSEWGHKKSRADDPAWYWAAMALYAAALFWLGWLTAAEF